MQALQMCQQSKALFNREPELFIGLEDNTLLTSSSNIIDLHDLLENSPLFLWSEIMWVI